MCSAVGLFLSDEFHGIVGEKGVRAIFKDFIEGGNLENCEWNDGNYYCAVAGGEGANTAINRTQFDEVSVGNKEIYLAVVSSDEVLEVWKLDNEKIKEDFENKKNNGKDGSRLNIKKPNDPGKRIYLKEEKYV